MIRGNGAAGHGHWRRVEAEWKQGCLQMVSWDKSRLGRHRFIIRDSFGAAFRPPCGFGSSCGTNWFLPIRKAQAHLPFRQQPVVAPRMVRYLPGAVRLGMFRFPSTTGGKSFTSSYTSVMKRSLLCLVSPSVVASYGALRFAASTSSSDLP